jgi:hypothetical protein
MISCCFTEEQQNDFEMLRLRFLLLLAIQPTAGPSAGPIKTIFDGTKRKWLPSHRVQYKRFEIITQA